MDTQKMLERYNDGRKRLALSVVTDDTPLSEFSEFAEMAGIDDLTIGDIIKFCGGQTQSVQVTQGAQKPRAQLALPGVTQPVKRNLRLAAERERYDQDVIAFLKNHGTWATSQDIQAGVPGAKKSGFLSAINRLIENGSVEYRGKTSATKYRFSSNS